MGFRATFKFSKIKGGSAPYVQNTLKLCQKFHLILLTEIR